MRAEDRRVGRLERLLHLRRLPLLGTLPPDDLGLIAEQTRPRLFRQGEVLLRRGEPIGAVHVVVEGRVGLRRGEHEMGHATTGAAVGGLGFLARDDEGIDASAEEDTLTLELDTDTLGEILEDRFRILQHLLRETSRLLLDLWHQAPRECAAAAERMEAPGFSGSLDLVERMLFLRQGLPFLRSSASALADLARNLVELRFDPGVVLWRRGEPARQVLMLVSGRVACSAPIDGFGLAPGPGYPLGGLDAVAGMSRWYDAVCDGPVVTLSGDVEILFDVFEDSADVALDYLSQIARTHLRALELVAQSDRKARLLPFFGSDIEG
jgi:CRP-like cAMP-binding protein